MKFLSRAIIFWHSAQRVASSTSVPICDMCAAGLVLACDTPGVPFLIRVYRRERNTSEKYTGGGPPLMETLGPDCTRHVLEGCTASSRDFVCARSVCKEWKHVVDGHVRDGTEPAVRFLMHALRMRTTKVPFRWIVRHAFLGDDPLPCALQYVCARCGSHVWQLGECAACARRKRCALRFPLGRALRGPGLVLLALVVMKVACVALRA